MQGSGSYVIDPDDAGSHKPFTVFRDMSDKNGVGVTIISHNSETRTRVKGYEDSGSYVRDVTYIATDLTNIPQLASLTDVSTHCEQFIKYECRHSVIFRGDTAWWVSRTGAKMTYWGGATPADHNKCACGVSSPNSCADSASGCTCEKNDGTWREDSGLLTEKSHLPVTQLRFGDTGDGVEDGYHTLGKLKCYGMEWIEIVVKKEKNETWQIVMNLWRRLPHAWKIEVLWHGTGIETVMKKEKNETWFFNWATRPELGLIPVME